MQWPGLLFLYQLLPGTSWGPTETGYINSFQGQCPPPWPNHQITVRHLLDRWEMRHIQVGILKRVLERVESTWNCWFRSLMNILLFVFARFHESPLVTYCLLRICLCPCFQSHRRKSALNMLLLCLCGWSVPSDPLFLPNTVCPCQHMIIFPEVWQWCCSFQSIDFWFSWFFLFSCDLLSFFPYFLLSTLLCSSTFQVYSFVLQLIILDFIDL